MNWMLWNLSCFSRAVWPTFADSGAGGAKLSGESWSSTCGRVTRLSAQKRDFCKCAQQHWSPVSGGSLCLEPRIHLFSFYLNYVADTKLSQCQMSKRVSRTPSGSPEDDQLYCTKTKWRQVGQSVWCRRVGLWYISLHLITLEFLKCWSCTACITGCTHKF